MIAVPAATPLATPPELIPAVVAALLLHAPPVVAHASVVDEPTTTLDAPVIAAGAGFTSIADVLKQPALTI
jgi:hypothetical protein